MAHERRPVCVKQRERLGIGKMTLPATDPFFQVIRISAALQHLIVVIALKENGVTLLKMMNDVVTHMANVGKYTHANFAATHYKTVRIRGIVRFLKGCHHEIADRNSLVGPEGETEPVFQQQSSLLQRWRCNINWDLMFA